MIQAIEFYSLDHQDYSTAQEILENTNRYTIHPFTFDHVFTDETTQLDVYELTAKPAVLSILKVNFKLNDPFKIFNRVIMQQFLLMDRQVQEKLIQWKVSDIIIKIPKEVLFLAQWRKYSNILRIYQILKLLLWSELAISKFIMKSYLIY